MKDSASPAGARVFPQDPLTDTVILIYDIEKNDNNKLRLHHCGTIIIINMGAIKLTSALFH